MGKIRFHRESELVTLELSNPRRGNALDFDMLDDLEQALERVELMADNVKLLVLKADQSCRHFCTGADIAAWSGLTPEQIGPDWIERGNALFDRLAVLPVPTVALVHGLCLGGGLELALATDLIFAADTAAFAFPEVSIGAIPGWKGGLRLSERIGRARAARLVLTAKRITASQALGWGLIDYSWPLAEFFQKSHAELESLLAYPGFALREAKRLLPVNGSNGLDGVEHGKALRNCMLARRTTEEN